MTWGPKQRDGGRRHWDRGGQAWQWLVSHTSQKHAHPSPPYMLLVWITTECSQDLCLLIGFSHWQRWDVTKVFHFLVISSWKCPPGSSHSLSTCFFWVLYLLLGPPYPRLYKNSFFKSPFHLPHFGCAAFFLLGSWLIHSVRTIFMRWHFSRVSNFSMEINEKLEFIYQPSILTFYNPFWNDAFHCPRDTWTGYSCNYVITPVEKIGDRRASKLARPWNSATG